MATSLALGSVQSCSNSIRQRETEPRPTPFSVFHTCAHPMQSLTLFQGQLVASMSDHVHVCQKFCLAGLAEGTGASADSRHWLSESTAFQGNTAPPGTEEHTHRWRRHTRQVSRQGARGELRVSMLPQPHHRPPPEALCLAKPFQKASVPKLLETLQGSWPAP